jgi:cytochrome P450
MEEGKVSSQHDLLSVMISTLDQDQDQLATNEDIKDNILMFLFAGHDTSVSTLAGALKYLFLNPQCLQQVIKEQKEIAIEKAGSSLNWDDTRKMKYTWQVMQECLRIQPAVEVGFRECIKEFEYEGFTIPKGWRVSS